MTQPTVEERLEEIFELATDLISGGAIINNESFKDSIKGLFESEIQLAEQKAREELKKVIIEKGIDLIDIEQDINLI